ncbi:MAG: hypothetical protein A3J37_03550 [Alphaproteobacteria bacterium RIFCSPHIGHO2_12_FULL_45_9]|nr:MAG: hypothetical protein A3B66_05225 [Alphaproteobacteria bacterium RIFCSPHIGHO2_02_FULL_46_13]OFW99127.1 MAG: hypothetical protein A3J37_03550 [Alphaproteobacteria bacterium RIFCSPHIGHO2_12_FULL_45_9]
MSHGLTDPRLLEVLVDPMTKVPLRYDAAKQELICDSGRRAYPIRDGIPIMLVSEARMMTEEEVKK